MGGGFVAEFGLGDSVGRGRAVRRCAFGRGGRFRLAGRNRGVRRDRLPDGRAALPERTRRRIGSLRRRRCRHDGLVRRRAGDGRRNGRRRRRRAGDFWRRGVFGDLKRRQVFRADSRNVSRRRPAPDAGRLSRGVLDGRRDGRLLRRVPERKNGDRGETGERQPRRNPLRGSGTARIRPGGRVVLPPQPEFLDIQIRRVFGVDGHGLRPVS